MGSIEISQVPLRSIRLSLDFIQPFECQLLFSFHSSVVLCGLDTRIRFLAVRQPRGLVRPEGAPRRWGSANRTRALGDCGRKVTSSSLSAVRLLPTQDRKGGRTHSPLAPCLAFLPPHQRLASAREPWPVGQRDDKKNEQESNNLRRELRHEIVRDLDSKRENTQCPEASEHLPTSIGNVG